MVDLHGRVVPGKAAFRLIGTCGLMLLLFWNPLVLRPRFWNLSVFFGFLTTDATLLVGAAGLLYLRKWAALLFLALSGYLAFVFSRGGHFAAILIFVLPLIISVAFWRDLMWGKAGRDSLLIVGGVIAAGVVDYLAFFIRPH
jgi:hypothetical protein